MQRNLTLSRTFSNDVRFNTTLLPVRRNRQPRSIFNRTRTGRSTSRKRTARTSRPVVPKNVDNTMSSNTLSIENKQIHQESSRYDESEMKRDLSPLSQVESTNDSISECSKAIVSQRRLSLPLIKNEIRECTVCLLDQPIIEYEERYSDQCEHSQRTICNTCVYNNIKFLLENLTNNNNNNIHCLEPNCKSIFYYNTIRYIISLKDNLQLFERYDQQITHEHLEKIQEFVWCAYNECGSGSQIQ
ncbi:unnamed protein product [Adineta steineri]|uniref:RING-type domain-containing protein n=1 Tax=Adineta steineri TaxID=433720 RepID=A0A815NWP7_9BILA|nr:unnamed protein product [Adineta steineri]CAF3920947.1 unnamed protein product [Adineta steineri]